MCVQAIAATRTRCIALRSRHALNAPIRASDCRVTVGVATAIVDRRRNALPMESMRVRRARHDSASRPSAARGSASRPPNPGISRVNRCSDADARGSPGVVIVVARLPRSNAPTSSSGGESGAASAPSPIDGGSATRYRSQLARDVARSARRVRRRRIASANASATSRARRMRSVDVDRRTTMAMCSRSDVVAIDRRVIARTSCRRVCSALHKSSTCIDVRAA